MKEITQAYIQLLKAIDLNNPLIFKGIREGLNKFLSNAYLSGPGHKYEKGHFYSNAAYEKVKKRDWANLIFEHMVPKHKYLQKPCVAMAKKGQLNENDVVKLVNKYWKIAIITVEEDKLLKGKTMPKGWDGEDIFLRYTAAGIDLTAKDDLKW